MDSTFFSALYLYILFIIHNNIMRTWSGEILPRFDLVSLHYWHGLYSHILDVVTMNLVMYIGYSDNLAKNPMSPPLSLYPLCTVALTSVTFLSHIQNIKVSLRLFEHL